MYPFFGGSVYGGAVTKRQQVNWRHPGAIIPLRYLLLLDTNHDNRVNPCNHGSDKECSGHNRSDGLYRPNWGIAAALLLY